VSIFNFHYAEPRAALDNQALGRPLGDDETGFDGNADRPYRTEAWHFLLSGGAIFSNLDYSFTVGHEDGTAEVRDPTPGGGGPALRRQLRTLRTFLEGFQFTRMRPEPGVVAGGVPAGATLSALVEPGRQYAVYLGGGDGSQPVALEVELPAGSYAVAWMDPKTGTLAGMSGFDHQGGRRRIEGPRYQEDLALKLLGHPR
jgi:hypothetical protein